MIYAMTEKKKSSKGLQKPLELMVICFLKINKFLGKIRNSFVIGGELVQVFKSLDDSPGVALDHHSGCFGIGSCMDAGGGRGLQNGKDEFFIPIAEGATGT